MQKVDDSGYFIGTKSERLHKGLSKMLKMVAITIIIIITIRDQNKAK